MYLLKKQQDMFETCGRLVVRAIGLISGSDKAFSRHQIFINFWGAAFGTVWDKYWVHFLYILLCALYSTWNGAMIKRWAHLGAICLCPSVFPSLQFGG
jgi:hypothetical protein